MKPSKTIAFLHRLSLLLAAAAVAPIVGCPARPTPKPAATLPLDQSESRPVGPPLFEDMTARSGIQHRYHNGEEADQYTILESLGGGVALLDYDRDGLLDIFVTGGGYFDAKGQVFGYPCRLYHNEGNWHFRDVTAEVGLDKPLFYSNGCAVADYDNDGWPDLLVTGYGRLALYHNNHGHFEEVTAAAGLLPKKRTGLVWPTSAAWADLDGDGYPDLVVAQYVDWSPQNNPRCPAYGPGHARDVCPPNRFGPLQQKLYLNNGNGTFRDASKSAGMKPGKGLGVLILDLDEDGRPDIYITTDTSDNQLYLNQGHGRFTEVGRERGVATDEQGKPDGSMGVDAADYDGSGHFSLFVTNYVQQTHALYRNRGRAWFDHVSSRAGLAAFGMDFSGFGCGFLDYDNDGVEDLVVSQGHVVRYPPGRQRLAQRPLLLHNSRRLGDPLGPGRFQDVTPSAGPYFRGLHRGRGMALGDLDNDGKVDIVISHCNEPVVLLRNHVQNGNHWLGVHLTGRPNRDAVGAKLILQVGGQRLERVIKGGGSYLSSSDRRVVFGLGKQTAVQQLTVRWPSGRIQSWPGGVLSVDQYVELIEGVQAPSPSLQAQTMHRPSRARSEAE